MKRSVTALLLVFVFAASVQAENDPPFRVVYFDNYAPYSWLDSEGNMRGVLIDILNAVIRDRMGRTIEHTGLPWARAQQYVRIGEYDAMIAPVTEERRGYANISGEPVLNSRMTMFTHAAQPRMRELKNTEALKDLSTFRFITQVGDGWARENLRGMEVRYVRDLDSVLRVLSQGRADLFVEASLVTHWNLKNLGLSQAVTEVEDVTIEMTPYHLMISKQSPHQLQSEFDQHMQSFLDSGAMDQLLQKYKQ